MIRPFGPADTFVDRLRKGKPIIVPGDGNGVWASCHVDDVARGFIGVMGNPKCLGQAYNITGDEWMTWNTYHEQVAEVVGGTFNPVYIPTDTLREAAPQWAGGTYEIFEWPSLFDNSKIKRDTDYTGQTISWREGVRRTVAWLEAKGRLADSDERRLRRPPRRRLARGDGGAAEARLKSSTCTQAVISYKGTTMSIFEDTNPHSLKQLLSEVDTCAASLPNFQRSFVWDPNATQELISSIAYNYPAGSLLRIRNTQNLFACREIEGAPILGNKRPTYLVLDGQQRLTSLYQAFYGKGDHNFYLNLTKLLAGKDFDECLFHLKASSKQAKNYDKPDVQADELVLPLSVLRGGTGAFSIWSRDVRRTKPAHEQRQLEDDLKDKVEEKWIKTIDNYMFPVVTLSDSTSAEAVCTIFETLNRTGVKLSVFDLLTARFWPKGVDLRKFWADAQQQYPVIGEFQIDPYYLLQAVSLAARSNPSCKKSDVLDLDAITLDKSWSLAAQSFDYILQMLRDDCGVMTAKWVPYSTLLVPMAAVVAKSPLTGNNASDFAKRQKLQRWFWCSVFGQAYENSPNSQAAKDVNEVLDWIAGGSEPDTVRLFRFDALDLRETTPRQRAIYRGTISLILSGAPRDFFTGKSIDISLINNGNIDDHHIFPQAYLKQCNSIAATQRDCVLNRTLIDKKTNIIVSDRAPSDYMVDIEKHLGASTFLQLLDSHILPSDQQSPLRTDDFDAFLDWRQNAIKREIDRVTL